jgi:hypothetical protein
MEIFSCYSSVRIQSCTIEESERFASKSEVYRLIHHVPNDFGFTRGKMQMGLMKTRPKPIRFSAESWPANWLRNAANELTARELGKRVTRLVGKRRRGVQSNDFFEFGFGFGRIVELLVCKP